MLLPASITLQTRPQYEILLIEENGDDAQFIQNLIANEGPVQFNITHVDLLADALLILKKDNPHLLLLNLELLDSNNLDSILKIRHISPTIPIVILTGADCEATSIVATQLGAQDLLVKGLITSDALLQVLLYEIERRYHRGSLKCPLPQLPLTISEGAQPNISDPKVAEHSFSFFKEQFQVLLDTSPNCIFITDNQEHVILANKTITDLLGISQSDIVGKPGSDLHFNTLDETGHHLSSVTGNTGENPHRHFPVKINSFFQLPDGTTRWFNSRNGPIAYPFHSGCTLTIAMDVTEQCMAQEELRNSELRFRAILDAQMSRVVLLDPQRRILWPNAKACEDAGLARHEIIGLSCHQLWGNEAVPCTDCPVTHALETGKPYSTQMTMADNSTWRIYGFPVWDDMDRIVSAVEVVENITERVVLEDQLRQAQKMESLGTLAGGIAHDFNNILAGILGYTELALDKTAGSPKLTNYMKEVYSAGLRAAELTRQILTFSRRAETHLSPLAIEPIVREALKLLRSTLPTSIDFKVHVDQDLQQILADPTQIHQIVMNLCTNASHAMEPLGGVLDLSITQIEINPKLDTMVGELKSGRYLKLSISDTGCGMSPEIVELIFDPYFTTKDLGEGTGLGLSVVHGIIKEYGGDISVDSTPGIGTTFNLFFPTAQKNITNNEHLTSESLPRGNEHILVVDDEPNILKLCTRILEQQGYLVTTANNGSQALELFKQDPHAFDLVFSDVTMPKLAGDQLARAILTIRPNMPVILCTGHSRTVSGQSAQKIGVRALLVKPVVKKQLVTEVRRAMDRRKGPKRRKTDHPVAKVQL